MLAGSLLLTLGTTGKKGAELLGTAWRMWRGETGRWHVCVFGVAILALDAYFAAKVAMIQLCPSRAGSIVGCMDIPL